MITELFISPTRIGTVALSSGSVTITGTNTRFTSAMIGREISFRTTDGDKKRTVASYITPLIITVNTALDTTESGCYYYTTYEAIDLTKDIPISLNYSIADIREPEKRNSSYSKTITIPGTKNNNATFDHIFEIDSDGGFNPNIKADAILYADTIEVFKGILQLSKITTVSNQIEYECNLLGRIADIFYKLKDAKLTDLDLSEYDHVLNSANQVASWSATVGQGYIYPLINYGNTTDAKTFHVKDLQPGVYLKTYIDKIFAFAGFTYTSAFFNTTFFKRLFIPFNNDAFRMSSEEAQSRVFSAGLSPYYQERMASTVFEIKGYKVRFNTDISDVSNQYNTSTYEWTVEKTGYYDVTMNGQISMYFTPTVPSFLNCDIGIYADIIRNSSGVISTLASNSYLIPAGEPASFGSVSETYPLKAFYKGDAKLLAGDIVYTQVRFAAGVAEHERFTKGVQPYSVVIEEVVFGDTVKAVLRVVNNPGISFFTTDVGSWINIENSRGYTIIEVLTGSTVVVLRTATLGVFDSYSVHPKGYIEVRTNDDSTFYNSPTGIYAEGDTILMNAAIPANVSQKDIFSSVIKLFNLYLETDKNTENNLIIEPRNDFYSGATNRDWTNKLDTSSALDQTPMGDLDALKYIYKYKEDKDFFNDKYFKQYKEPYGSKEVEIVNDFVTETREIEPIFSPTPLVSHENSNRVIPEIYAQDDKGKTSQKKFNIRLLYYGGLKTSTPGWDHKTDTTTITRLIYPFSGHLDDPFDPTLDLNFGIPETIEWQDSFDSVINYTNNNLHNKYHKQFIEEITDKNSKIVTGYFYLTPLDIALLDFRDNFFVDGHYLRLNKIYDYDPQVNKLTKCEFIKIKVGVPFTPINQRIYGGYGTIAAVKLPTQPVRKTTDGSNNNTVDQTASNVLINGTGNTVQGGAQNITITGNNNTITSGVQNVTLINTSGVTVTTSNETWIDGKKIINNTSGFNLIQGGLNEVRSVSATSNYNLIQGGLNEVRSIGATSSENYINGGLNSI